MESPVKKKYTFAELHEAFFPKKDILDLEKMYEIADEGKFFRILDKLSKNDGDASKNGKSNK